MTKLYFSFINNGEILLFLLKKMLKKIYSKKSMRSDEISIYPVYHFLWILKNLIKVNYISQKKVNDILFEKKESINNEINNYLQ